MKKKYIEQKEKISFLYDLQIMKCDSEQEEFNFLKKNNKRKIAFALSLVLN